MKRSRALGWLGGLFVVAALVLGACSDDPDDARQIGEQPAQQAAVVTITQQVQTQPQVAAAQQPAAQADAEQAEPAAQVQAQQEDETAADSASGSASAEGDASSADPELLAQLAEISALNTVWSEQITSLEMHSVVTLESDLLNFQQTVKLWMQLEPLRMYMETELPNFFAGMAEDFADEGGEGEGGEGEGGGDESSDAGEDAPPPLFVLKVLVNEDGVFMAPPESEGWVRVPDEGFDISQVMALGGGLGDEISDAISAQAPLLCAEISNGTVTEEELDGRPVWLVSCDVDADAVGEVLAALNASGANTAGLGMPLGGEGVPEIQAMSFMVWIDRETGAVPAFNSVMSVSDGMMQDDGEQGAVTISTVATLIAWNSPIEFPLPEPLLEEQGYFE